jgi:hypothetical protein
MNARADHFVHLVLPSPRWWLAALAVVTAAARTFAKLRDRVRQPHVSPMSVEWLQSHAADRTYQSND